MSFSVVSPDERKSALDTLVMAFAVDPVIRWFYAEPWRYLTHYADFIEAFGGQAFDEATAWQLEGFAAAGVWLSPNSRLDGDAIMAHLEASVPPEKQGDLFSVIEQMDQGHPDEPHWYLAWLGVDVAAQGRGLGDRLLRRCLEIVDESRAAVYLDNTNPRNIPFYERHGFRVTGASQAGECPPLFGMLREAR